MENKFKLFISANYISENNIKIAAGAAPKNTDPSKDRDWVKPEISKGKGAPRAVLPSSYKLISFDELLQKIKSVEKSNHLPENLLLSFARIESAGAPNAVSPAGALGLLQFTSIFRKQYNIKDALDISDITPHMQPLKKYSHHQLPLVLLR